MGASRTSPRAPTAAAAASPAIRRGPSATSPRSGAARTVRPLRCAAGLAARSSPATSSTVERAGPAAPSPTPWRCASRDDANAARAPPATATATAIRPMAAKRRWRAPLTAEGAAPRVRARLLFATSHCDGAARVATRAPFAAVRSASTPQRTRPTAERAAIGAPSRTPTRCAAPAAVVSVCARQASPTATATTATAARSTSARRSRTAGDAINAARPPTRRRCAPRGPARTRDAS